MKKIIVLIITFTLFQFNAFSKKLMDKHYWNVFYECEYSTTVSKQYDIPFKKMSELEKIYACQNDLYYLLAICSVKTNHNTDQILINAAKETGFNYSTIQDIEMFFRGGNILTNYVKNKNNIIDSINKCASIYEKHFLNHKVTPIIQFLHENDQGVNGLQTPDSTDLLCQDKTLRIIMQFQKNVNELNFNYIKNNCLDKNGNIPSYTDIGFDNQGHLILILVHYAATVRIREEQFFNFIDEQLKLNRIFPNQYAVIIDKYFWVKNNTLVYGQITGGDTKIINMDKIDETRKKIGLNSLREFYEVNNMALPENYK